MKLFNDIKTLILLLIISVIPLKSVYAQEACILDINGDGIGDGTAGALPTNFTDLACGKNTVSSEGSTAIGTNAQATGNSSTAVGIESKATGSNSVALGHHAVSLRNGSTAVGDQADAFTENSTAIGRGASVFNGPNGTALGASADAFAEAATSIGARSVASGRSSLAIGHFARVQPTASIAIGGSAEVNNATASNAIALGYRSKVTAGAEGAIAIGSWLPTSIDNIGARVSGKNSIALGAEAETNGENAIAIGANSFAKGNRAVAINARNLSPNTVVVGDPLHVIQSDGSTQIRAHEQGNQTNVQTLANLICDRCTPAFRFSRVLPSNDNWFFRMLQNGDFSVDDPATITKEAEFRSGGDLKIGGTLIQASSREIKTDFTELNGTEILKKIDQLPVTKWSYKKDNGNIQHIGPMAEDFYSLFSVGLDNKGLSSVDTAGVALAAVKSLHQLNKRLKQDTQEELAKKDQQIALLQKQNIAISERMHAMESKLTEMDELKQHLGIGFRAGDN